jgi:hypothetical protein
MHFALLAISALQPMAITNKTSILPSNAVTMWDNTDFHSKS